MKRNRENSTKETSDTKEGNDTMSATARNFVYEINGKVNTIRKFFTKV